jgi:TetR/AcrR family transcriptional regulator, cholesterol catabolism regulator
VVTQSRQEGGEDRQEQILDAVLRLLAEQGIAGVSHRSVARVAGVAHGLVGYYYEDKVGLVAAALRRIGEQDAALIQPDPALPARDRLSASLRRVADPEFLTTEYLSLRLQLWSLAKADEQYEQINNEAQQRYRKGLADLIRAARPDLTGAECRRRATDINVVQNGLWLTFLLGLDRSSVDRAVARCEEIALRD